MSTEREDFEAWVRTTPGCTDYALRRRDMAGSEQLGLYFEPAVQYAWWAWQARATLPSTSTDGAQAGFVLVPVEPTPAMCDAVHAANVNLYPDDVPAAWRAMVAAASPKEHP